MLATDPGALSVRYEVDKGQTAAGGQEQEGHGQTQEVWKQQEAVLLPGGKAGNGGAPAGGGASWRQQKAVPGLFGEFSGEFRVL